MIVPDSTTEPKQMEEKVEIKIFCIMAINDFTGE